MPVNLHLIAAQHALGVLNPLDAQRAVSALADIGCVMPSTLHAITARNPRWDDVLPALEEAMGAAGVERPELQDSVHLVMHHRVLAVLELAQTRQEDRLWPSFRTLIDMTHMHEHLVPMSDRFMGDLVGMSELVGIYWTIDYRWEDELESGLTQPGECHLTESDYADIVSAAQTWLREHSRARG